MDYTDWVNILLQCLAIGVIFSGAIGFLTIRNRAKKEAKKVARQVSKNIAKEVAERVANEYMQENLPDILDSYRSFFTNHIADFNAKNLNKGEKNETK